MDNPELVKQYKAICSLIDDTDKSTGGNLELQGHWGRYLCVLVSGFLENAISAVYVDFVDSSASPHVVQYTRNVIERINNPKSKKFVETARQFKKDWGEELEEFLRCNPNYKSSIDSIMTNRHRIAHGKTCTISVHSVREYLDSSVKVVDFIEDQCKNRIQ